MSAYNRKNITYVDFQSYLEAMEQRLRDDRKEAADRLEADRKEATERLTADRKEAAERQRLAEERLAAERRDFEAKFMEERREARATRNWLIATFITVIIGFSGIFAALLVTIYTIN